MRFLMLKTRLGITLILMLCTALIFSLILSEVVSQSTCSSVADRCRPLLGGLRITIRVPLIIGYDDRMCSLGFPVYVIVNNQQVYGVLTCAHCVTARYQAGVESIYQPTIASENYIGFASRLGNYTDSAFIPTSNFGVNVSYRVFWCEYPYYLDVAGSYPKEFKPGSSTEVHLIAATSGCMSGYPYAIDSSNDPPWIIKFRIEARGGDSGGVLIEKGGDRAIAIGIVVGVVYSCQGGSCLFLYSIAHHIGYIIEDLGVNLYLWDGGGGDRVGP
ncbi:MAG: hypothetical protein ABWJ42_03730 [Sulfolobales archaeon]